LKGIHTVYSGIQLGQYAAAAAPAVEEAVMGPRHSKIRKEFLAWCGSLPNDQFRSFPLFCEYRGATKFQALWRGYHLRAWLSLYRPLLQKDLRQMAKSRAKEACKRVLLHRLEFGPACTGWHVASEVEYRTRLGLLNPSSVSGLHICGAREPSANSRSWRRWLAGGPEPYDQADAAAGRWLTIEEEEAARDAWLFSGEGRSDGEEEPMSVQVKEDEGALSDETSDSECEESGRWVNRPMTEEEIIERKRVLAERRARRGLPPLE